jgi:tRNA(Leu) C34 or U34 (ribose-2'-O)-methylase TrmL
MPDIFGKKAPKQGVVPAVALVSPRFPHNVGAAMRAASCFGVKQVWFSGERVRLAMDQKKRLPREERMKGFKDVELRHYDEFLDQFDDTVVPVAVELRPGSESLSTFEHPKNALYVFGPEDGNVPAPILARCHRFVAIPTRHCVNLSAAVYIMLYDRLIKENPGVTVYETLAEERHGWPDRDDLPEQIGLVNAG